MFADGAAWVTNYADETLTRIDATTNRPTTIGLPNTVNPAGIAFSGGYLWVCAGANNIVLELSPTTGKVLATLRLPGQASWTGFDARTVWVSDSFGGTVSRVDAATARVVGTSRSGTAPADGDVLAGVSGWATRGTGRSARSTGPVSSAGPGRAARPAPSSCASTRASYGSPTSRGRTSYGSTRPG